MGKTTYEESIKVAKLIGQTVKIVDPNTLHLDLDTPEQLTLFQSSIQEFIDVGLIMNYIIFNSKSGGCHYHVLCKLQTGLTIPERIALQSILGSDSRTEKHRLLKYLAGDERPVIYFK